MKLNTHDLFKCCSTNHIDTIKEIIPVLTCEYILNKSSEIPEVTIHLRDYKYYRSADFKGIFDSLACKSITNTIDEYFTESNKIALATLRGAGDILVCSLNTSYKLDNPTLATPYRLPPTIMFIFHKYPKIDKFISNIIDKKRIATGKSYQPLDRFNVIIDNTIEDDIILIGYSGKSDYDRAITLVGNEFIYVEEIVKKCWVKLKIY